VTERSYHHSSPALSVFAVEAVPYAVEAARKIFLAEESNQGVNQ
jgi:hypothetical protein